MNRWCKVNPLVNVLLTAIFILLAILFVEVCMLVSNFKEIITKYSKLNLVKVMICILVALLGFGYVFLNKSNKNVYKVQKSKQFRCLLQQGLTRTQ